MNAAFAVYGTKNENKTTAEQIVATSFEPRPALGRGAVKHEGGGVKAPQLVCKDGRAFYVTKDREKWEELRDAGEIVFSEQELLRLGAACKECDAEGAKSLANGVLELKAVFDGAYIKRGGKKVEHHGDQGE